MITGIDIGDVSGNRLGVVADQECGVGADIIERHQPVFGSLTDGAFQQFVEMIEFRRPLGFLPAPVIKR